MTPSNPHFIIVAGEASGDMHAAHLVREIRALNPAATFSGLGGSQMQAAGVELDEDLTKIAVVGFIEVLKHYSQFHRIFHFILKKILERQPAAVILVDYPGFNLRLAKAIKAQSNIKVIYYISPQVWAWKENRVATIRAVTDKMMVLFPFEEEFYRKRNTPAVFVGHPLVDTVVIQEDKETLFRKLNLDSTKITVGLLPGSRQGEIKRLLPVMLQTVGLLTTQFPQIQLLLIKAPTIERSFLENFLKGLAFPVTVIEENSYDAIAACNACLVASGTATLETALLKVPMFVVYKTVFLTWLLAKALVKIPDIGLVNIVAGKRIVPEFVQYEATAKNIAAELSTLLTDTKRLEEMRQELVQVAGKLGTSGASRRAAEEVLAG